jgi:HPt (histidine-containing phosphotransfer) domain-containing protein
MEIPADGGDGVNEPIRYDALLEVCDGDESILREVLDALIDIGPAWVQSLGEAVAEGDRPEMRRLCHLIVGSAGTLCANELLHAATRLQQLAIDDSLARAPHVFEELRTAYGRVHEWAQGLNRASSDLQPAG